MRPIRIVPGEPARVDALGSVLVRDISVDGDRWAKGRRLSAADLARVADGRAAVALAARGREPGDPALPDAPGLVALALDEGDVHEDEAALRLARAVAGAGVELRGPAESRVDLVARVPGVLHVRADRVERIDRIDPLQVFTAYDGQTVAPGELVASVKIGPHAVAGEVLDRGILAARSGPAVVRVAPFLQRRVAAVVREAVRPLARERFERGIEARVSSLGSILAGIHYATHAADVVGHLARLTHGSGRVDVVLTAGAASTDPTDAFFVAIERLGGRVIRHGVPAHPGSMIWLARIGRTDLLGLPTCGAYSRATAADLLLPRLLTGERASNRMAASLGHGGVLTRAMRFRFPPYARQLDAPEG
jgi:molybdopterin biosynthesis enzyme